MSRLSTSRLLAGLSRPRCVAAPLSVPQWTRVFSQSPAPQQPDDAASPITTSSLLNGMRSTNNPVRNLVQDTMRRAADPRNYSREGLASTLGMEAEENEEPYHFHIYAHRHNTHITVTKPNRDAIISLSCGNLGFKKSQRKSYDAAYQLGAYVVDKLHQQGHVKKIDKLEVMMRGFGPGREAVTKVLLGTEGRMLRDKITRVGDATRLKFGGTRSPKVRRLG
ncbi:hypothetical protein B0T17DRAFT_338777 [Bombardia bombarda]|uniref:Small ribosomal subunit protein uS11m n=1 Tax=Bombardia bombarda TaxID=252184 RepID=A0AA39WND7_9PEZI|nr:hypothetical protein B0T17DRAFT_338777 [Bombardia bombarda]